MLGTSVIFMFLSIFYYEYVDVDAFDDTCVDGDIDSSDKIEKTSEKKDEEDTNISDISVNERTSEKLDDQDETMM